MMACLVLYLPSAYTYLGSLLICPILPSSLPASRGLNGTNRGMLFSRQDCAHMRLDLGAIPGHLEIGTKAGRELVQDRYILQSNRELFLSCWWKVTCGELVVIFQISRDAIQMLMAVLITTWNFSRGRTAIVSIMSDHLFRSMPLCRCRPVFELDMMLRCLERTQTRLPAFHLALWNFLLGMFSRQLQTSKPFFPSFELSSQYFLILHLP